MQLAGNDRDSVLVRLGATIALLLILGATLVPFTITEPMRHFGLCFGCDEHGNADAILNVILFVPLGVALARSRGSRLRPVVFCACLSAAVEIAQFWIPGRDPSLGDVLCNTLGGGVGQLLAQFGSRSLVPQPRTAARLSLGAAAGAGLAFGLTARLFAPAFPLSTYYVRWTPDAGPYRGRVLTVELGSLPLPPQKLPGAEPVRTLLQSGAPLQIVAIAGPKLTEFRSLFRIRDARDREIFILGPDRDDLAMRFRIRGSAWRLDQPDLRVRGVFDQVSFGDTLRIVARRDGRGYCLTMNGVGTCPIGFTIGSGWSLLWYSERLTQWLQDALGIGWVAGLVLPVGFWSRQRPESGVGIAILLISIFAIPPLGGLLSTPLTQVLGAAGGWTLGAILAKALRRRRPAP